MQRAWREHSAVYKGNDHEDGNGARTVHGPISISLARSLGSLPATFIAVELTPLSHLGQQVRSVPLHVSPDAVSGALRGLVLLIRYATQRTSIEMFPRTSRVSSEGRGVEAVCQLPSHGALFCPP
jgi:hypothetical protein